MKAVPTGIHTVLWEIAGYVNYRFNVDKLGQGIPI